MQVRLTLKPMRTTKNGVEGAFVVLAPGAGSFITSSGVGVPPCLRYEVEVGYRRL